MVEYFSNHPGEFRPVSCQVIGLRSIGQKSIKAGFNANSLAQTFALLYEGAGLEGASSHSGRRTFLTNLANKGTAIHILKALAGHRSISTTAAYLYSSPSQLKAAVELV
jgi:integrase/recombinase XerD